MHTAYTYMTWYGGLKKDGERERERDRERLKKKTDKNATFTVHQHTYTDAYNTHAHYSK